MKKILLTPECLEFISNSDRIVQTKFKYLLEVIGEQRIIHKAIVDKLVGTDYYELRIKTKNQIRIIIYTIDHANFQESNRIILLNGFLKRTNADYRKAVITADKLKIKYIDELK